MPVAYALRAELGPIWQWHEMAGGLSHHLNSSITGGLALSHSRVAVKDAELEALSTVSSDCSEPVDAVFLTAVALTLFRYGHSDRVSVHVREWETKTDSVKGAEACLRPSPGTTVRQCVKDVAAQLGAVRPVEHTQDMPAPYFLAAAGSSDALRTDIHGCVAISYVGDRPSEARLVEFAERAIADATACLSLSLYSHGSKVRLLVVHRSDVISSPLAKQLTKHVLRTMSEMGRNLDLPHGNCGKLTPAQKRRVIEWSRGTIRDYPLDGGLKALFERQSRKAPDALALIDEDGNGRARSVTYGELNAFANIVARALRRAGAKRGRAVAVVMRRSVESVSALISIIKIGAIYVPIDESYPDEYVRRILQEAAPDAILATPDAADRLDALLSGPPVVPIEWSVDLAQAPSNPRAMIGADATLMIMYTSGSTGASKGVVHRQHQVLNRLHWMWETYPFTADEMMCQRSPLTVMPSIWELLGGLLKGVGTAIAPLEVSRDPARMAAFVARHRVTRLTLLPSLLMRLLVGRDAKRALASLQFVIVGGEMLPLELYRTFRQHLPETVLIEDYGCTEVNTIWHYAVTPGDGDVDTSPGGRPIANLGAYVLDRVGQLAPPGLVGELAVAGASLAVAYLGSPKQYDDKFVTNDIDPKMGPVLYRTGDLAFYGTEGTIKLIGRADHQLTIRGMQVEPSEVERTLATHDAVDECCAVSRSAPEVGGELVVFLTLRDGAQTGASALRSHLNDRLPSFMIPSVVVFLDRLQKTLNGKLDRRELTARANMDARAPMDRPAGRSLTQRIRALLAEVLGQRISDIEDKLEFRLMGLDSALTVTLAQRLTESLGMEISPTMLFEFYTVSALSDHLGPRAAPHSQLASVDLRPTHAAPSQAHADSKIGGSESDVAVIGMAGRFPDAETIDALWANLIDGRDSITEVPEARWAVTEHYDADGSRHDTSVSKWGAFLPNIGEFDPLFFRIAPSDAAFIDPQHRIGLEEAWHAFEDSGYSPDALEDTSVGTFIGLRKGDFESLLDRGAVTPGRATLLGADPSMLAARIAFRMNLRGPSLTVDTACSSSLSAIHLACRNLIDGECDMALAGGVCIVLSPDFFIATSRLGIFSPTGKCRAFDRDADGFVQGEGAGFVILKRLGDAIRDGDNIHAVVKGTALTQDGRTNGIGVPSSRAQTDAQSRVYRKFGIDPLSISFVEAHGTGTQLGDQIEVESLTRSFGAFGDELGFCAIGSIKTNIGHLTAAAGVAGFIKAVLCLKHRQIPPSLNFEHPNPSVRFEETPFFVNADLRDWLSTPDRPRRAAINSFGLSGTNVHCVLEEAPHRPEPAASTERPLAHLILLGAQSHPSLLRQMGSLRTWIKHHGQSHTLRDVAYTLLVGRERQPIVRVFVAVDFDELDGLLADAIAAPDDPLDDHGTPRALARWASLEGGLAEFADFLFAKIESDNVDPNERRSALLAFGELAASEFRFEIDRLFRPGAARRISLPGYDFDRQSCWPSADALASQTRPKSVRQGHEPDDRCRQGPKASSADDLREFLRDSICKLLDLDAETINAGTTLDAYGYDSIIAVDLKAELDAALACDLPINLLANGVSLDRMSARVQESVGDVYRPAAETDESRPEVRSVSSGDPGGRGATYPLTDMQSAYFFGKTASGDGVGCHTYLEFEVADLNPQRLARAWNRLVGHHPMLRTKINREGNQTVLENVPAYEIETVKVGDGTPFDEHLDKVRQHLSHRLYQPGEWPLFDIRATLCPGRRAVVHVSMDSWIVDWVSAESLYATWRELYERPDAPLKPLELTFRDYVAHMDTRRRSEDGTRQRAYWLRKLARCPDGPTLPYIDPVSPEPVKFRRQVVHIDSGAWQAIQARAAALAVFPTSMILACFAQTLMRAGSGDRFAVVLTHAHRRPIHGDVGRVVGPFTSASVCIVDAALESPLEDVVLRLNEQLSQDLHNRDVCASGIIGEIARESGRLPILPIVFTARLRGNDALETCHTSWLDDVTFSVAQSPGVALENRVREVDGRLEIVWDIAESKLPADVTDSMMKEFLQRLETSAVGATEPIARGPDEIPLTALQQSYLAARISAVQGPWAEGFVYQEFDVKHQDVEGMATALRQLFEQQPALAGTMTRRGHLRPDSRRRVPIVDVEDLTMSGPKWSAARLEQVRGLMLGSRAFQENAPSVRARVSIRRPDAMRVHIATDMAAADGLSVLLVYLSLLGIGDAPKQAPATVNHSFVDHLIRLKNVRASRDGEADRAYWIRKADLSPGGPRLPRPATLRDGEAPAARLHAELTLLDSLKERAKKRRVGVNAVLIAALNAVVSAWSETVPFMIIAALTARDHFPDVPSDSIGDFTSFSWVTDHGRPQTFAQRVRDVETNLADDLKHWRISPIEALRRSTGSEIETNRPHTVVFTGCLTDPYMDWPAEILWGYGVSLTPGVDFDCYVHNLGGQLNIHWDYRRTTLGDDDAAGMFAQYTRLLERVADSDETWDNVTLLENAGADDRSLLGSESWTHG